MKNTKRLLVAAAALLSAGSMATFMQPSVPVSEDAPMRISGGVTAGALFDGGFRLNNLGPALGFTHNVGYDFEYGLSATGSWANGDDGKIFAKEKEGIRLDTELMVRFMPEVADGFHVGGLVGAGWGRQLSGLSDTAVENAKSIKFGDIAFRVGPAFSYAFTDAVALYGSVAFGMNRVRFLKDTATQALKDQSNRLGLEGALGMFFSVADNTALFIEAAPKFRDLSHFTKSYKQEVSLGVSFAI